MFRTAPGNASRDSAQFYRWLFGLERHTRPDEVLTEALRFIVEDTGAALSYLELYDGRGPRFRRAHSVNGMPVDELSAQISQTIIVAAISNRRLIETPCALADARFEDAGSVRRNEIHASMCAPIMEAGGVVGGVIYLQGQPGLYFTELARERLLALAHALAYVTHRLNHEVTKVTYHSMMEDYASSLTEEAHRRNGTNAVAAARDLSIDRRSFYRRWRKR